MGMRLAALPLLLLLSACWPEHWDIACVSRHGALNVMHFWPRTACTEAAGSHLEASRCRHACIDLRAPSDDMYIRCPTADPAQAEITCFYSLDPTFLARTIREWEARFGEIER